jgi:hypothetical protein
MNKPSTQHSYANNHWLRHKISVPIRVILSQSGRTSFIDARGNELSEGGLALLVNSLE